MKTSTERAIVMDTIVNSIADKLVQLKSRWMDEKEYEDFNEYKTIIKEKVLKTAPEGTKVLNITKSFVITLEIPEFPYTPEIYCTMTQLGWRSPKKK